MISCDKTQKVSGKSRSRSFLLLAAIILFHLINNLIWLHSDNTYLLNDSHSYFLFSFKVFDSLRQHAFPWLSDIFNDFTAYRWHGVFVQYLTAPFYFLFGVSEDAGAMVNNALFLTVLIFSIYGLGRVLFDERVGLLAAFTVSMYPLVFNQLRIYMLDLPLTAMVALSIFLLLKSEYLSNKKYSCLFAIASGFGLLTKFNFVLFIFGPVCLVFCKILKKEGQRRVGRHIAMVFLLVVLISFAFYRLKFWEVIDRIYRCSWFYAVRFYPGESLLSILGRSLSMGKDFLFWFIQDCVNNSVSFVFFVPFLVGCFAKNRQKTVLFLWLVPPLLILAFFFHYPNINRYFMPVLPAMALFSSAGIMALKNIRLRRSLAVIAVTLASLQFFAISYKLDFLPKKINLRMPFLTADGFVSFPLFLFNREIFTVYRSGPDAFSYPMKRDRMNDEILNVVLKDSAGSRGKIRIFFIGVNAEYYDPIAYESAIKKLPIIIDLVSLSEEGEYRGNSLIPLMITLADYVVFIREQKRDKALPFFARQRLAQANMLFGKNIGSFDPIKKFTSQNGSTLVLYKKKQAFVKIVKGELEFYFRAGVAKIYYRNNEITRDIGFDMSFKSGGKRYFAPDFQWDTIESSPGRLTAYAKNQDLPLSVTWEFDIRNEHEIGWKVSMEAQSPQKIRKLYLNLFLVKDYSQRASSPRKGISSLKNIYHFERIDMPGPKIRSIVLSSPKEKGLSAVMFSVDVSLDAALFPKWRNDLKVIGFGKKEKEVSLEKQTIFSGLISFLSEEP